MRKKYTLLMVLAGLLAVLLFTGFAVWQSSGSKPEFPAGGFIIRENNEQFQRLDFQQGDDYSVTLAGQISFRDLEGKNVSITKENFAHMDNDATFAFSDGVLLDFNDLSDNFINNYYIPAGMSIVDHNGAYTADTTAGALEFGEHLWKLTDRMYLIRSANMTVHFSENDVREAGDLVQVAISDDSVVRIQTSVEMWSTISPDCYILTDRGVKIYPVSLLVDNGTYKLSMAKLAVSADDAVVLTEAETRRQIVPELNIEAIDGEDGDDGVQGIAGAAGADGNAGDKGDNGKGGEGGVNGKGGASGLGGAQGTAGKDAVIESSSYNAIPSMSITEWNLTATSLSGTLRVTDPSEFFAEMDWDKYPAQVTITNVKTGDVISCYPVSDGTLSTNPDFDFSPAAGAEVDTAVSFDFSINSAVDELEPDTEYRLSVTSYYRTSSPPMYYQREFLNRVFTTDSTGVNLSYVRATTDTITVSASPDDAEELNTLKLFLVTEAQNEKLTNALIEGNKTTDDKGNPLYVEMLDPLNSTPKLDLNNLHFGAGLGSSLQSLTPNTKYIVRAYVVNSKTGLHALSSQELDVMTLKQDPIPDDLGKPTATYNRTNGAFEVWRPAIQDIHGGAVSYTYTAYLNGQKVASRDVSPNAAEPIEFRLNTATSDGSPPEYTFGVTMQFYDNEKTIAYDLKTSDPVIAAGATLPRMVLDTEELKFNKLIGDIYIPLTGESKLSVSPNMPLEVSVYADQIMISNTAKFSSPSTQNVSKDQKVLGNITLQPFDNAVNVVTTEAQLSLNLTNLYYSTNYAISVSAYLDLGDGNGPVKRTLGTVTFATPAPPTLTAVWTPISTGGNDVLSVKLRLCENPDSTTPTYAMQELMKGQVTLTLYQGSGARPQQIAQKNFVGETELKQIYGTGYHITQDDFPNATLSANYSYTLTITGVVDSTYSMSLPYMNRFTKLINPSKPLEIMPSPPELRPDPDNAIKVGTILNSNAGSFGGKEDPNLPKNAVVGFTLESDYDNKNRIGKSITYYAYEYQSFYNAMDALPATGSDPLSPEQQTPLMQMTEPINSASDYAPKVAVLFGGTKSEQSVRHGEYQVYWAGSPAGGDSLSSGMGRGYRYIFAYSVQYQFDTESDGNTNTVTGTYPNNRADYSTFNNQFGGITLGTNTVGRSKENAYVLNSGMIEAPNIMPEFFTYLYETKHGAPTGTEAGGTVTLHYAWRDPEGLITTGQSTESTKILYDSFDINTSGASYIATDSNKITKTTGENRQWYSVDLPYVVTRQEDCILNPAVDIQLYDMDYTILEDAGLPADSEAYPLTSVPVEWPYQYTYNQSTQASIDVVLDNDHNMLKFSIRGSQNMDLARRAVGLRVTLSPEGSSKKDTFNVLLTMEGGLPTAKLPTSELGSAYMPDKAADGTLTSKKTTIHSVEVIFDSGIQGWRYVEEDPYFTLQYTNNTPNGKVEYGPYHGNMLLENLPASHAMLRTSSNFKASDLRKTITANFDQDSKYHLVIRQVLLSTTATTIYLYPDGGGVDSSTSISTSSLSQRYEVPKKLTYLPLTTTPTEVTISGMTPTMDEPSFRTSNEIIQPSNFKVYGLENTDTIQVVAYHLEADAESLSQNGVAAGPMDIKILENNTPELEPILKFTQSGEATYYLAFYYNDGTGNKHLRYGSDMEIAVFPVSTSSGVKITSTKLRYVNESYFTKQLSCDFSISRPQFINMRCDIYQDSGCTNKDYEGDTLLSFEEMRRDNIISGPINVAYNSGVTLNLTPDPVRQKLVPGNTYYLRVEAHYIDEDAPNQEGELAGFMVQEFTITDIGRYGALIYVSNAGKNESTQENEIVFQVTINDTQFSFMAPGGTDEETISQGALYAVRFLDGDGKLLRTKYDKELYSAYVPQKVFTLNNAALKEALDTSKDAEKNPESHWNQIKANEMYTMLVFAVPDPEHDGVIPVYNLEKKETESWTWADFFKEVTDPTDSTKKIMNIHKLIDSFWDMGNNPSTFRKPVAAMDGTRSLMQVAEKHQNSGTADGGYVFNQKVYVSRKDTSTFRITFRECFNLTKVNSTTGKEESVFQRIDYFIEGSSDTGPVDVYGSIRASTPSSGNLIQKGYDSNDYLIYYLDVPVPLAKGYFDGVFHFYESEGDLAAKVTISCELTG